jgi:hypothetical protein
MSKSCGNWNAKILADEDKLETIALPVERLAIRKRRKMRQMLDWRRNFGRELNWKRSITETCVRF